MSFQYFLVSIPHEVRPVSYKTKLVHTPTLDIFVSGPVRLTRGIVRILSFRNLNRIYFNCCFTSQLHHLPNLLQFPWRPLALVHTQNLSESLVAWGRTQTQKCMVQDCVWQLLHLGLSIGSHTETGDMAPIARW